MNKSTPILLIALLLPMLLLGQSNRPLNMFYPGNIRFSSSIPAARSLAMGGGAIALPDDPSAVTINPAGLGIFSRPALSATTRYLYFTDTETAYHPAENIEPDKILDQTLISALVVWKNIRFGSFRETIYDQRVLFTSPQQFVVYPGETSTNLLRRNFPSREIIARTQLVENGLSVGFRIGLQFTAGILLRLTRLEYGLTDRQYFPRDIYSAAPGSSITSDFSTGNLYATQTFDERSTKPGFTIGVLNRFSGRLVVGAVYHFRPTFNVTGETYLPTFTFRNGQQLTEFPAEQFRKVTFKWNMPDAFGAGFAYKYRGWMNLTLDLWRVRYSEMTESLADDGFTNLIQNDQAGNENEQDLLLEDSWEWHAGMEYIFRFFSKNRRFPVRFGFYRKSAGVLHSEGNADNFQQIFPKPSSENHYTGGLGFLFGDRLRFDGAIDISANGFIFMGTSVYTF